MDVLAMEIVGGSASDHPIRVHALYKPPEIPANSTLPAIAVSVTYKER
jgi:hypothetical protein